MVAQLSVGFKLGQAGMSGFIAAFKRARFQFGFCVGRVCLTECLDWFLSLCISGYWERNWATVSRAEPGLDLL